MDSFQQMMFMSMSFNRNDGKNNQIIVTLLMFFISQVIRIIPFNEIQEMITNYLKRNDAYISINISSHEVPVIKGCSSVPITKLMYSKSFLAIIHYLTNNNNCKIESLTEIMTNSSEFRNNYFDEFKREEDNYIFMPLNNKKMLINYENNDIFCEFNNIDESEKTEDDKKKDSVKKSSKKNFIIILSLKKNGNNDISILNNFIHKCIQEYDKFTNLVKKNDDKLYIYEYKYSEKSDYVVELFFNTYPMEHNKDLNTNIFFEGKDETEYRR
jgi:hypothetical protein